jgi:hypothetical protein
MRFFAKQRRIEVTVTRQQHTIEPIQHGPQRSLVEVVRHDQRHTARLQYALGVLACQRIRLAVCRGAMID